METDKKLRPKSVRLDPELAKELEEYCDSIGIKQAFMVRRFIRAGLRTQAKHALILEPEEKKKSSK